MEKILESACGSGNLLKLLVNRYITDCLKNNFPLSKIIKGLESDIYAFEIDSVHHNDCINELNSLVKQYGICEINWQIYNENVLEHDFNINFDFIIGNPPYVTYQELNNSEREDIKERFKTCSKGKFDYCYAFIEHDLNLLSENGYMSYLIPSSIFKNVFAHDLRNFIKPYLIEIHDYTTIKLFPKVLTSSAIIVCKKTNNVASNNIKYNNIATKDINIINKDRLSEKWEFNIAKSGEIEFSAYFKASIVIATLLNKAFILDGFIREGNFFTNGSDKIEAEIVRPTASPRTLHYNNTANIIFPYKYINDELTRYSNDQFQRLFPHATTYLTKFKEKLEARDADKNASWFEYGRSQALKNINNYKLLTSTVITNTVKVYELQKEIIPYSGIYITQVGGLPLEHAKQILESDDFFDFITNRGIYANGSSIRITARDINSYTFNKNIIKNY